MTTKKACGREGRLLAQGFLRFLDQIRGEEKAGSRWGPNTYAAGSGIDLPEQTGEWHTNERATGLLFTHQVY